MIGTFEERRATVQAIQLTPDTVDEVCRWTHGYVLGPDRWIPSEGCWRVSALRWYRPIDADRLHRAGLLIVGIRTRNGENVIVEDEWVVQASGNGGGFQIIPADMFNDIYSEVHPQ
jgi:hypothetical protein